MALPISADGHKLLLTFLNYLIENRFPNPLNPKDIVDYLAGENLSPYFSFSGLQEEESKREIEKNCESLIKNLFESFPRRIEAYTANIKLSLSASITLNNQDFELPLECDKILNGLKEKIEAYEFLRDFLKGLTDRRKITDYIFRIDDFVESLAIHWKLTELGIQPNPHSKFSTFINTLWDLREFREVFQFFSQATLMNVLNILFTLKDMGNANPKLQVRWPYSDKVYIIEKVFKKLGNEDLSRKLSEFSSPHYSYKDLGLLINDEIYHCKSCDKIFLDDKDFDSHRKTCTNSLKQKFEKCLVLNPVYWDQLYTISEIFAFLYSKNRIFNLVNGVATHNISIKNREVDIVFWLPDVDSWLIIEVSKSKKLPKDLSNIITNFTEKKLRIKLVYCYLGENDCLKEDLDENIFCTTFEKLDLTLKKVIKELIAS